MRGVTGGKPGSSNLIGEARGGLEGRFGRCDPEQSGRQAPTKRELRSARGGKELELRIRVADRRQASEGEREGLDIAQLDRRLIERPGE